MTLTLYLRHIQKNFTPLLVLYCFSLTVCNANKTYKSSFLSEKNYL